MSAQSSFSIYNTLSRHKEIIKPIKPKKIGLYTCGPTVYNYAHIGNLRTYLFEDFLERALTEAGYKVKRAMNVTDVGHLTSDADEGEDKLEKGAAREHKTPQEIAKFYTEAFIEDADKLNIKLPKSLRPASQFIPEQIAIIKKLFKSKYAYETSRAVYFDISRFKQYGKLSGQSLKEKITAARKEVVEDSEKKNPADFALWFKAVGKFEHHLQRWPSPWGVGFPGWHIECSAISRKFLSQPFDIHTGGVDHIGTHHTNEIAQSEAAFGKPLSHIWMHGEHLQVDGGRMGKSLGNFYTVKDIIERGIDPIAYRYLVLSAHYRSKLNFTWDSLRASAQALKRYQDMYMVLRAHAVKAKKLNATGNKFKIKFGGALSDDLNMPKALAVAHEVLKSKLPDGEKI
ncbi:MAG: cysteine--tRNA ligase, partial [Candidatus Liptonbacteria bacterium]